MPKTAVKQKADAREFAAFWKGPPPSAIPKNARSAIPSKQKIQTLVFFLGKTNDSVSLYSSRFFIHIPSSSFVIGSNPRCRNN